MIPDFRSHTIDIARLDWALHFWTDDNWEFVLSEPVLVTWTDEEGIHQETIQLDVEPQPLPPLLSDLEGSKIINVLVSAESDLGIQLEDKHLTVRASPSYDAWQINGEGGEMFICPPGGELTHFSPLREDAQDEADPAETD